MSLGERLLEYRTNAKMSQDTLAEMIGVTRQTISKWETDQSTPEFNKILPLCEVFGITTDELIKGEKSFEKIEDKEQYKTYYNEKRNKKKAIAMSISVFLYCIGAFSVPYMIETLQYNSSHAVMITTTLWTIATVILIYFFVSHPKEKKEVRKELHTQENKKVESIIIQVMASLFLLSYIIISFVTMAWHITWILWIVFVVVVTIIKLILELKKGENDAK